MMKLLFVGFLFVAVAISHPYHRRHYDYKGDLIDYYKNLAEYYRNLFWMKQTQCSICQNGGTPYIGHDGQTHCNCPEGFHGQTCSMTTNETTGDGGLYGGNSGNGNSRKDNTDFDTWRNNLGKTYATTDEENKRRTQFQKTVEVINLVNNDKTSTYKLETNAFADMTDEERAMHLGLAATPDDVEAALNGSGGLSAPTRGLSNALTLDWRSSSGSNYVSAVKDQGSCGSCYAFASTAAHENRYCIKNKLSPCNTDLSEQEIVDCTNGNTAYPGNAGCGGGWPYNNYKYTITKTGLDSEPTYPYTAVAGTCRRTGECNAPITNYVTLPSSTTSETALENALQSGSVVIGFYVQSDFYSYKSGVYAPRGCGTSTKKVGRRTVTTNLGCNHAMVVVGYTSTAWIVRNSWGASWGQSGYVYVGRATGGYPTNVCNILVYGWYPVL